MSEDTVENVEETDEEFYARQFQRLQMRRRQNQRSGLHLTAGFGAVSYSLTRSSTHGNGERLSESLSTLSSCSISGRRDSKRLP